MKNKLPFRWIRSSLLTGSALMSLAFGSCQDTGNNVQGNVYGGVHPVPVPFTMNIPFDAGTASSYVLSDPSLTELVNGVVRLKSASQSDSDNSNLGFGGGATVGMQWDNTNNLLRLNTTTNTTEHDISWTPQYNQIVAYWKLNESAGAGSAVDSSSGGHTGTPTSVTFGATGQLRNAITLNGTTSYVAIPAMTLGTGFTISAWAFISGSPAQIQTLIASAPQAQQSAGFKLLVNTWNTNDKKVMFENGNGGAGGAAATVSNAFSYGVWNHIVAVVNKTGTSCTLYVNGRDLTASATIRNDFNDSLALRIGTMTDGAYPWTGSVDDVAIWSTRLTAAEVMTIYSRQSAKYSGSLTSRVMQGYEATSTWLSLAATSTAPFFKELPSLSNTETSSAYTAVTAGLTSSLAGLWHLNEASGAGSAGDSSGSGNSGTPTAVTFGQSGAFATAALLNGTSSQVAVPYSSRLSPTQVTVSAWFNSTDPSASQQIVANSFGGGYELSLNAGGACPANKLCFLVYVGGSAQTVSYASSNLAANRWYHVMGTFDGTTLRMYLNGQLLGASASAGLISYVNTNEFCLGSKPSATVCGASQFFSGLLDEVAVWNRAVSAAEVVALYRRGANRLKYQVRACSNANCSDQDALTTSGQGWKGPTGSFLGYFSELQNNDSLDAAGVPHGQVKPASMNLAFTGFAGLSVPATKYFQYRVILESDDAASLCSYGNCSPELKSVQVGPDHYLPGEVSVISGPSLASPYKSLTPASFAVTGENCAARLRFAISGDGVSFYYWNGSGWTSSANYSTASPASDLNSNLATFPSAPGQLQIKTYLKTDGLTPCQVDGLAISGQN